MESIEIAAGSVIGAEHRRTDRPNQDAAVWRRGNGVIAAVVADGCGSGRHSEVGARVGAALWAEALCRRGADLERARRDTVAQLRILATAMGGDLVEVVREHFLFTLVGCAIAGGQVVVHAIGDGLYAIDGEVASLGPFPDNQPPYLGYDLIGDGAGEIAVCAARPVAGLRSIALATDGAAGLDVAAMAVDPRSTGNRDAIRRRLALINREVIEPDWEARRLRRSRGPLADDTTVLIIRLLREGRQAAGGAEQS